jgi:hypothetical protein
LAQAPSPIFSLGAAGEYEFRQKAKVLQRTADNVYMNVSGPSMTDSLANLFTGMQAGQVQAEIAVAVLKQIQDQQGQQAQALLKMISQAPSLEGTGQIVDLYA